MIISVLRNTPAWVWLVLALTFALGLSAMRPHSARLWRLSLLPSAATAWTMWKIAASPMTLVVFLAWTIALMAGAVLGFRWALSRPPEFIDRGRVRLSGTPVWLGLGLVTFALYYALNVFLSFHQDLQSVPEWIVAHYVLGGASIGFVWGWLAGLIDLRRLVSL